MIDTSKLGEILADHIESWNELFAKDKNDIVGAVHAILEHAATSKQALIADDKNWQLLSDERVPCDGALNEAAWAFWDALPPDAGKAVFNHIKPALKAAIEKWLDRRALLSYTAPQAEPKLTPCRHCGFRVALNESPAPESSPVSAPAVSEQPSEAPKVGALIYGRPDMHDCLMYQRKTSQGSQKLVFADRDDAQRYADQNNLQAVHEDEPAAQSDGKDTARLNWLETMTVNVRVPLRYGSRDLFWANPDEEDGTASDLREQIDIARALAQQSKGGE